MNSKPSINSDNHEYSVPQTPFSIGARIRQLRDERGYSLKVLAEHSGLNINTISLWENDRSSPTVGNLQQLAQALGVPLGSFFEQDAEPKPIVFTPGSIKLEKVAGGIKIKPLGKGLRGGAVQTFIVQMEPGAASSENWIVHTGYEFVYCLEGSIIYHFENEMQTLVKGDSLVFESRLQHHWHATEHEGAEILMLLLPSDPRESPAERHFIN